MKYSFICYGHQNITAKHKTTLEFTKDKDVTLNGDCIIGVNADFSLKKIKKFIENKINANKKIQLKNDSINEIPVKIIIKINKLKEEINGFLNPDFDDDKEVVIRKTNFISERTFAVKADKAAADLSRDLAEFLKEGKKKIKVIIEGK